MLIIFPLLKSKIQNKVCVLLSRDRKCYKRFPPTHYKKSKMSSGLCCCSPCRPTYKRHVDNIFPAVPQDGLVKNKMETLVYYALTSAEKLDRIGEYLAQR